MHDIKYTRCTSNNNVNILIWFCFLMYSTETFLIQKTFLILYIFVFLINFFCVFVYFCCVIVICGFTWHFLLFFCCFVFILNICFLIYFLLFFFILAPRMCCVANYKFISYCFFPIFWLANTFVFWFFLVFVFVFDWYFALVVGLLQLSILMLNYDSHYVSVIVGFTHNYNVLFRYFSSEYTNLFDINIYIYIYIQNHQRTKYIDNNSISQISEYFNKVICKLI